MTGTLQGAVVLASAGRPELLAQLLGLLQGQSSLPLEVVISVPDEASLPDLDTIDLPFTTTVVTGTRGLAAQRNSGIAALTSGPDYVVFFDDDAVPSCQYLTGAAAAFDQDDGVVGLTGRVLVDGAVIGEEIPLALASAEIAHFDATDASRTIAPTRELYGCNFAVRADALTAVDFDGRLPLYSWLEDLDFARRLARTGRLVRAEGCAIAHLGSSSGGRVQHLRFGYSQVTNPIFIWKKGSISMLHALTLIIRPAASNIAGSLGGSGRTWRRQRLAGNLKSVSDLLRGRVLPERITAF